MTGCRSWLSELNESVTGTVKFGDGSLVEIKGRGDVKAASVKIIEKMIDEEKIDGSVKIESEKKTEKREEKKSDGEKIVGTVKFESEEKSDGVMAEVQNVATEVAKAKEIKEKDCDDEKKEQEDENTGCAIEKQVAGETKAEKEKEKEAIVSDSAIEVAQVIKPVEEKLLAGQVEQVIKTVNEKQLPIGRKTEKKEGGDNGDSFHPVKRSILWQRQMLVKEYGQDVY